MANFVTRYPFRYLYLHYVQVEKYYTCRGLKLYVQGIESIAATHHNNNSSL